jgi:hypothetical protein
VNENFITDPNQRQKVLGAYQMYSELASRNLPWMEEKMGLNKNSKEFFKAMRALALNGIDTDTAMTMSAQVLRNPDAGSRRHRQAQGRSGEPQEQHRQQGRHAAQLAVERHAVERHRDARARQ